jgi:hypothetical protein
LYDGTVVHDLHAAVEILVHGARVLEDDLVGFRSVRICRRVDVNNAAATLTRTGNRRVDLG